MTAPARRVRYQVAASLDGCISGPNGEADWIPMDPDIDFAALFGQFDTLLMGRKTFEATVKNHGGTDNFGMKTIVVSRTLAPESHPGVEVWADRLAERVAGLKAAPGRDIWLFGGGELFRGLVNLGLVDRVEVAVVPAMLGGGLPLLPPPAPRVTLKLAGQRTYEKSGIVLLEYDVAT